MLMRKDVIDSEELSKPLGPYSHGVKVRINGTTLLFISGVVAFDSQGKVVGKGDIEAQTRQVLENLKGILEREGASFKDIVKITNFYMNFDDYPKIAKIRSQYFGDWLPASTGVEVKRLIDKDLLIEIEAIAVI
jgi:2-iminobutanoate/2-iminopropanoate deaminase